MSDKHQDQAIKQSARRRLIRGSFAAPVALTMYSGSSHANASLTCVARQFEPGHTMQPPSINAVDQTGAADQWVRVLLRNRSFGPTNFFFVYGGDLALLNTTVSISDPNGVALTATNYLCFSKSPSTGGNAFIVGNIYAASDFDAVGLPVATSAPAQYAAVRFNSSGDVVGIYGNAQAGNSAISETCWASFKPGSNPKPY